MHSHTGQIEDGELHKGFVKEKKEGKVFPSAMQIRDNRWSKGKV